MKPGRLYIKIFLSFLLVLVVTEVVIFVFFMAVAGKEYRNRLEHAKALIVKEIIEEKLKSSPDRSVAENESLKDFMRRFDQALGAYVWLAGPDGTPLVKSFDSGLPDGLKGFSKRRVKDFGDFKVSFCEKGPWGLYAIIPISVKGDGPLDVHLFYRKHRSRHPAAGFAIGLALIGGVIALLIIPISRFITGPIRELKESALCIAEGDLSHRASIKRKDELGQLGRAFNHMAERLERMIRGGRELTANISHELRSPLARIRVAAELIRDRLRPHGDEDWNRHLDEIRQDIEELDHLIGKILDLSKLDIHEKALNLQELDLAALIRNYLERFTSLMEQKGLNVVTDLPGLQTLQADPAAMGMALNNILDNAVKFAPQGGRLEIKLHREEDILVFQVTNTFEVLPQDELHRIFEPFHRLQDRGETGSGLGLAITKKAIEKHGGTIEAANTEGGLTIRVSLPLGYFEPAPS
jgi:two-component system sensor histidine kinase CpxA